MSCASRRDYSRKIGAIWTVANYPWSVRLKPLMPEWLPWIRQRFRPTTEEQGQVLRMSAHTMGYRVRPYKRRLRKRLHGRTKPGTLPKHHIPLMIDHWDLRLPGFMEIGPGAHSGNSAAGDFCFALNLTDICIG